MVTKVKKKEKREQEILLGLVKLFLETGKPIGSSTLQANGFDHLSSATIRNYFAKLEAAKLLQQPHISGGRIPTSQAFKWYAQMAKRNIETNKEIKKILEKKLCCDVDKIYHFLEESVSVLAEISNAACVICSPRFDQDTILDIKLLMLDHKRLLCALVTNFGVVNTYILNVPKKISAFSQKRIENYLQAKLQNIATLLNLNEDEKTLAEKVYQEVMVRYIVNYTNFSNTDLISCGFSNLLQYKEFNNPLAITKSLSLFENEEQLRAILQKSMQAQDLVFWIAEDLKPFSENITHCSILAMPYKINEMIAGAILVYLPMRADYKMHFSILKTFSEFLSKALTKTTYKHKITFRTPTISPLKLTAQNLDETKQG
ncbi:MAG: Heat-inducible transcription repressor HrcA [Chlamydiae bacterium]|nr:Heat-inducible transcription repressor HrcA [Chlamydiota bacterium]